MDPAVVDAVGEAGRLLASLGHSVEEQDPDWGWIGNEISVRYLAGIADHGTHVDRPERLEPRTRGMLRMGGALPAALVRRSREREAGHAERLNRIFEDFDALITPVTGVMPPEIGHWAGKGALRTLIGISREYPSCIPWNYTGQPAASIPLAPERPGATPRAFQVVVPPNREDLLLSLSAQLEAEIGWPEHIPEELR
jgi:amidase